MNNSLDRTFKAQKIKSKFKKQKHIKVQKKSDDLKGKRYKFNVYGTRAHSKQGSAIDK